MPDLGQVTPQELIAPYFDLLTSSFGDVAAFVEMSPHSSESAAEAIMANPALARDFTERIIPRIFEASRAFWRAHEKVMVEAVRQLPGMKATFGGDIGPQRYFRQLERGGLYFDTVLVQDPLLRAMRIPELAEKTRITVAIKYALELVWQSPLYLAPMAPPIAVLIPDRELGTQRPAFDERWEETRPWATLFWSQVLEREFENYDEVRAVAGSMRSSAEFLDAIRRPELFRMDAGAAPDPRAQWAAFLEGGTGQMTQDPRQVDTPYGVLDMLRSRLMMANDILNTAHAYDAQPLVGAPVSFHYTVWRGQAIQAQVAEAVDAAAKAELVQTNALLGAGLNWLGNVTEEQLVVLRQRGRLEDMRALFRSATDGLKDVALRDIESVAREMDHRLEQGLRRHEEEVRAKDQEFKDELKIKGGSLILSAVGATAPLLFAAPPAWLGYLGLFGAAQVADIVTTVVKHTREKGRIASTPIAILLDLKRDSDIDESEAPGRPWLFVQPMPEFEWDPAKIGGVAYMIPEDPKAGLPMAIGPAFSDMEFADQFFKLVRAWNADKERDTENNIRLSFVIEAEKSYSMFLYPSMERREVREYFERAAGESGDQLVAQWVFCKRFNRAAFKGLELFAQRHREGDEFFLGAFFWKGEGTAPEKITSIRPLIKKHFKLKRREELQKNEVEFWTGGDRTR